jgi:hypothetical protein
MHVIHRSGKAHALTLPFALRLLPFLLPPSPPSSSHIFPHRPPSSPLPPNRTPSSAYTSSLTPPTVAGTFTILDTTGGSLPAVFGEKIKACLESMPAADRLVTVPTMVILIPNEESPKLATSKIEPMIVQILEEQFEVSKGCPSVDASLGYNFMLNENGPMAEGEAEYYSTSADGCKWWGGGGDGG